MSRLVIAAIVVVAGIAPVAAQRSQPESRGAESGPATTRRASVSFPKGVTESGSLSLDLHKKAYPFVRGRVNGVETEILIDSGANTTAIDSAFVDSLGLKQLDATSVSGTGGTQQAAYFSGVRIDMGRAQVELHRVIGIDLSSLGARIGRALPVIMGSDVFEALIVDLNYPNSRVTFFDPSHVVLEGEIPLLRGSGRRRVIEVQIEKQDAPARLTFDTGSGNALELFHHYWSKRGFLESRPALVLRGGGIGGRVFAQAATLHAVRVAGLDFRSVPASFMPEAAGGAGDDPPSDGNLGAEILTRFRIVVDFGRDQARFDPSPDWNTRAFRKDRVGLAGVFERDRVRVTLVAPNSPAEKSGWRVGQSITAVDGTIVTAAGWDAMFERWITTAGGLELSLTDGDGKVRRLLTADYY